MAWYQPLPLAEDDTPDFDLQATYTATVTGARVVGLPADDNTDPLNVDAYSAADQTTIRALMGDRTQLITPAASHPQRTPPPPPHTLSHIQDNSHAPSR